MVKKIIFSVLALCMLLPAAHSQAANVSHTNSFTRQDETTYAKQVFEISADYKLVLQSDVLAVYLNEANFSLRILNKQSGYIYSSNLDNYESKGINNVWQNYFDSGVTIEFFDKNNLLKSTSLTSSESTLVTYQYDTNQVTVNVNFKSQKISFDVVLELVDDQMTSTIPFESIKDTDGILSSVVLFPGLGATSAKQNDGYYMMADGAGALVRFDNVYSNLSVPYASPYFGNDYGIKEFNNNEYNQRSAASNNFPYYGVVHGINSNGFVNWVESGSHHTTLQMYPAGLISDLYFITNRFDYRYAYLQPISDTETISSKMDVMFNYDAKETYQFATLDANFVGLTQLYKEYLVSSKEIAPITNDKETIPLQLRFLGNTKTPGFLDLNTHVYSTLEGVSDAYDYITSQGIESVHITLDSFNERFTSNALNYISESGSKNDLIKLSEKVLGNHDQLDYVDNKEWLLKGRISISKNARRSVTGRFLFYKEDFAGAKLEFFSPNINYIQKSVKATLASKKAALFTGLTIESYINSDFNGKMVSRETEAANSNAFFKEISQDMSVQTNNVTADSIGYADYTTNNITSHSLYPYFSDIVPLVSILTSGYTINYTTPLNFSSDLNVDLLKAIEFNLMPQYHMSTQPSTTKLLLWNESIGQFDNWAESIVSNYEFVNGALKHVYNAQIVDYQVITSGVNKVVYDNGYSIIINYLDHSIEYLGQVVGSENYLVVKE